MNDRTGSRRLPGDRDLATDLRQSPPDFFTRDLDHQVLTGLLDCAVHSAKDVPDPVAAGLDWFWLPWFEDPRDVIIMPESATGIKSEIRNSKSETNSNYQGSNDQNGSHFEFSTPQLANEGPMARSRTCFGASPVMINPPMPMLSPI